MTSFLIGSGFGMVAIACLFMVIVWVQVSFDKSRVRDRRFRVVAGTMATSSFFLSGLCFNRASEQILGHSLPLYIIYGCLIGLGAGQVALMSSSAIDGDRKMVMWFIIASLVWVAICAWRTFG